MNRFDNFSKAKNESAVLRDSKISVESVETTELEQNEATKRRNVKEKRKTYSFTLRPSEREKLDILAKEGDIELTSSNYLSMLINREWKKFNNED